MATMTRTPDTFADLRKAAALLQELEESRKKGFSCAETAQSNIASERTFIDHAISRCLSLEGMSQHAEEARRLRMRLVIASDKAALARVLLAEHPYEFAHPNDSKGGLPSLDRAHELIEQAHRGLGITVLAGEG